VEIMSHWKILCYLARGLEIRMCHPHHGTEWCSFFFHLHFPSCSVLVLSVLLRICMLEGMGKRSASAAREWSSIDQWINQLGIEEARTLWIWLCHAISTSYLRPYLFIHPFIHLFISFIVWFPSFHACYLSIMFNKLVALVFCFPVLFSPYYRWNSRSPMIGIMNSLVRPYVMCYMDGWMDIALDLWTHR
jgi:hypothetical protein